MVISKGQGVLLRISTFGDGGSCDKPRTFLVIEIDDECQKIKLLNVSSVQGKERKLLYDSNIEIHKYNPPFLRPSYVKLDALYETSVNSMFTILNKGKSLDNTELVEIKEQFNDYCNKNEIATVAC